MPKRQASHGIETEHTSVGDAGCTHTSAMRGEAHAYMRHVLQTSCSSCRQCGTLERRRLAWNELQLGGANEAANARVLRQQAAPVSPKHQSTPAPRLGYKVPSNIVEKSEWLGPH